ncbi:V-type ATP synthase subunit I [Acetanaerobacterium elongatum]|uniref:V/A-type H+-transporting ATPase subunit I n=1 Tax=Acetanaerobacterium elongatum TaxID=258515 RepID=A0A1G9ULN6_9FIRM|nr:V-type ATP synthase subunit I [Acetanaerobacterium elongatum]SDM60798.1 V/A-type H+-transporting ATPase subunit I [Acetanaerobacterium elongatum]
MAVVTMHRVNICALKKDRKRILEELQRLGVVEVCDSQGGEQFEKTDTAEARTIFEKNAQQARQAALILDDYVPEKKSLLASLEGRKTLSLADYDAYSAERDEVLRVAYRLTALEKEIAEKKADIIKLEGQIEALSPWLALPVSLRYGGTKHTAAFIGSVSEEMPLEAIYARLAEAAPELDAVNVDILTLSKEQTCVMATSHKQQAQALEEAMRAIGFARPASLPPLPPAEQQHVLEGEVLAAKEAIEDAQNEIISYAGTRNAMRFMVDYFTLRGEKYRMLDKLAQSKHTFVLSGYVPVTAEKLLRERLELNFDAALEFYDPAEEEDVPVLLKNNAFSAPVEGVLESYSLPAKGEIDPTGIMSVFYYILFGLMLSDAGYGLLLVLGCGLLLWRFKNMEEGTKRSLRMFFYCGISTVIWGILFSSYFGDVVNVVSKTFFGNEVGIPPLWFNPTQDPMRMLLFSFALGIVHLFFGLSIKFYMLLKAKQFKDALFDVVFWYLLVGGLIVLALATPQFSQIMNVPFTLPALAGTISSVLAGIGAVGIVLTGGRESRNWFKRILKGLYSLYNISGYLSDILSYSRLLALGLATGVIASVVNQMGSMGGKSIFGVILFVLVFLAGQAINFGIEVLGAYVHTNRLQYVEFFGKFYEGGRRKFEPFAVNTKYYKFKEDVSNG